MKIFITADMEGVAGVTHTDQVKMEGIEYEMARKWLTAEINASIEGILEAGATEIIVTDAHGFMRNIIPHELHPVAQLVSGIPRPLFQMQGIDGSCAAALMLGYHAQAGDALGVLSHTHVSRIAYEVRLNGKSVNEVDFNTAVAGHFGVPLAFVSGDDTLTDNIAQTYPWTERVTTKRAISRLAAQNLSPAISQQLIKAGAKRAIERIQEMQVVKLDGPIELEMHFFDPLSAQLVSDIPGTERINGRGIRYVAKDMLEVTRIWRLSINAALSSFPV